MRYFEIEDNIMEMESVDLYVNYGIERNHAVGGYLTVYADSQTSKLPHLRPAMLIMPGGAYLGISDGEGEPIAIRYAQKGFATFVLSYSIHTAYPAPLTEAMLAMRFIRDNAKKYNVDKDKVCAMGFSAGGHLCGMLATVKKSETERIGEVPKNVRPNAVIMSYAVVTLGEYTHEDTKNVITGGDKDLTEKLSIEKRVDKDCSPTFIWHTYEDNAVPVENSLMLASAYRKNKVPFALHIFEHGWHGLALCNENDYPPERMLLRRVGKWVDLSVDWLRSHNMGIEH